MQDSFRAAIRFAAFGAWLLLAASGSWAQSFQPMEIGGNYGFVHSNTPPGKCGCFPMNGGAGWFAYNFSPSLAAVGEVGGEHASNINGTTADLTIASFLAGPRYSWHRGKRIVPFGHLLLGGAHASGALTPAASGLPGSANAFAMAAGGGLDVLLAGHWTLRPLQLDYYLTRFDNAVNDHQNNLRIGIGVAFRLGEKNRF